MQKNSMTPPTVSRSISRRSFVSKAGAALAAITVAPRHCVAGSKDTPPSEKLNIACVGVGGRGRKNIAGLKGQNIIALCDVDQKRAAESFEKFPEAKRFNDFRVMLDKLDSQIDAVLISTPDHTHAVATLEAIRRGKHVYCEKPLANTIHQVRAVMKAARKHGVVTQLGTQGHSYDDIRRFCEWIWDGAIGKVHTIHAWCNSSYSAIDKLEILKEKHEVPPGLNWDLWLGPVPERPYNPAYLPGGWRIWSAFGGGAIGDIGVHLLDPSSWALDLHRHTSFSLKAEVQRYDPKRDAETFPFGARVTFQFAARGKHGPITIHWYDGPMVKTMPLPKEMEPERELPGQGAIVLGERGGGGILHGQQGAMGVTLFPDEKMRAYKEPPPTLPRLEGYFKERHYKDWVHAIRNQKRASADFSFGGPLTEMALLGAIGMRLPGQKLDWDASAGRFTNNEEANSYLERLRRKAWKI